MRVAPPAPPVARWTDSQLRTWTLSQPTRSGVGGWGRSTQTHYNTLQDTHTLTLNHQLGRTVAKVNTTTSPSTLLGGHILSLHERTKKRKTLRGKKPTRLFCLRPPRLLRRWRDVQTSVWCYISGPNSTTSTSVHSTFFLMHIRDNNDNEFLNSNIFLFWFYYFGVRINLWDKIQTLRVETLNLCFQRLPTKLIMPYMWGLLTFFGVNFCLK